MANFTYDLPFNHFRGAPQKLVNGWQLGAIATVSDGNPFTAYVGFDQAQADEKNIADRPILLPGMSQNPIIGSPNEYFNPRAFGLPLPGFFGDLGRDTLIGPGFGNVDLTFEKTTAVNERMRLLVRFEVFNLLNRPNFDLPNNTIFNSNGTYNAAAGLITATSTTSRQLQFGIKLLF